MGTSTDKESVLDVLSRMKSELKFDADAYDDAYGPNGTIGPNGATPTDSMKKSGAVPTPTVVKESKAPAPSTPESLPSEAGEDLSDYMGNLLKRYGKGSANVDSAPAAPVDSSSSPESHLPQRKLRVHGTGPKALPDAEVPAMEALDESSEIVPGQFCLLDHRDFVPRKRAPEEKACMDAMRELAVHSARKAIQVCDNKKRGFEAKHRLMLGFAAFAVSSFAFMMADDSFSFLGLVAMCGMAIGCMFVVNWQATIALVKKSNNN